MDVNGLFGDALAAVEEARLHGFSPSSAMWAAFDHLELADRDEAIMIASLLASWIATELNPTVEVTNLGEWLDLATTLLARQRGGAEA